MKPVETYIYVGGQLGLVGGTNNDKRKEFVRSSDYAELQDDVTRISLLYTQALNQIALLTKAGDALVLIHCGDCPEQHKKNCALAWIAAKEGKHP
jgi:hypothetical protein